MSKLLDQAIAKVRERSEAEQDEAAEMLFSIASTTCKPVRLDDETRSAVREGMAHARRGEFVSDADMSAFFKHNDR